MEKASLSNKVLLTLRSILTTLTVGFILFFYSETLFWGRPGRAPLEELVVTWLVYSVMTYLFLCVVRGFQVQGFASLFLAGALFGWLGEGVLAQTMYDMLPINLSWTGLAWHALISVSVGWYRLTIALQQGKVPAILTAAGIGAFWGVWAVMWWQPSEGGNITPLPAFAVHAFTQGVLLMLAYALFPRLVLPEMFTSRWGQGISVTLALLWFVFVAIPQNPLAIGIAPPLFALTLFALYRSRATQQSPGLLTTLKPVPLFHYLTVLIMPLCAVGVYSLFLSTNRTYPTNQWVYFLIMPLGFIAYSLSLYLSFKGTTKTHTRTV
ncbi:MAG: hypothetical protein OHK0029_18040 [Armatimonadaceae bacterium]